MGFFKGVLIFIEIVSALLLVGFILLQKTKDEGLGLACGAGVGETLFGSRAGNVLTKITVGLAIVFLADTLILGYLSSGSVANGSVMDQMPVENTVPVKPGPAGALPAMPSSSGVPAGNPAAGHAPVQMPATTTP